jgi:4-amino-4-deoxy-L-arabinose transferase-like glycosyltransferase
LRRIGKLVPVWLLSAVDSLPIVLPAAIAAFGTVAMALLLLGQLRTGYVWPLGLTAVLLVTVLVIRHYPNAKTHSQERHLCNFLVLGGLLAWGAFNMLFAAQHLITNRDPGTYANAGVWLVNHPNLRITATNVFAAVPDVSATSPGFTFDAHGQFLLAQGQHLLPVFLGLAGRIVGVAHMFQVNILFGMAALLAIYGFARLLVRPFWAMVVTGVLAASMPLIYFSRDTYTEPLAAVFTFGGLTLLWLALRSRKLSIWFLAGLVAGTGTLTRIDGYLTIVCLLIFLGIMLATAAKSGRNEALKQAMALVAGMATTALLGWLDVSVLSVSYYQNTKSQFYPVMLALVAVVVVSGALEWLFWRDNTILPRLDKATKPWRQRAAAAGVLLVALLLVSRPVWYRTYDHPAGGPAVRNFAELTTEWISWYIGPILALLGAFGLAWAAADMLKKRNLLLVASVAVIGGTALVYLVKPSIAPDQIWASRRLVPVILPGIAAFGAMALERLFNEYLPRLAWKRLYIGMAAAALLLAPLITSRHLLHDHDTALLRPVTDICSALPKNAAVLWLGTARSHFVQPTVGVCGVPAEGYGEIFHDDDRPSLQILSLAAQSAQRNGRTAVVGMYGSEVSMLPDIDQPGLTTVSSYAYVQLDNPVGTPPQGITTINESILMGELQPDGHVRPLVSTK